ncbi:tRNA-specific adenosine deaminase subunit tad3 [Coemansia sp. RSA 1286]|nr:tRNA-specific adenosine deaminase subunit tad3 [Coemansia sp. RSA 1286]
MIRIDRVLTNEEVQKLETEPVYTAVVEAPQMSGFLQFIGRSLPKLENLDHVKRVKRDPSSGQLTVLLCQSNKISEHQIRDIFDQTDGWKLVNISTAEVPRTPPYTKQQFDLWKQTWPVSFRPLEKLRNLQQQIAEEEMMTYAEKMYGELCQMQGRGAIIVDGSSKQELARSIGERHVHPLRHSVMCCVDQVGKQEVEKRKRKDQTENLAGGGAVKNTLLKEMSNHHDFTTEGLFHGLADGLGLTDAAQHLYVGSPTASEGYRAIYRRLCQLSKDNGATAEQRATVAKLEKFMHDIGLA